MKKDEISKIISKASVKEVELLHPERSFQRLFLLIRGEEDASGIILKEPGSDFEYRTIPEKTPLKILVTHIWKSKIDVTDKYKLVTVSLDQEIQEDDRYTVSKSIFGSVVKSFPEEAVVIAVLHEGERDEAPHFHFLMKNKT